MSDMDAIRARLLKMCSARHRIAQTAKGRAKHEAIAESEAIRALLAKNERLENLNASGQPSCGGCGGPHPFDTTVPSVVWNAVIRARGLSDYLCATCIIKAFAQAGESFTAELWGDDLPKGQPIEVRVGGEVATDASKVSAENTALRAKVARLTAEVERLAQMEARTDMDAGKARPL